MIMKVGWVIQYEPEIPYSKHCSSFKVRGMFEMNCLFLSGDFKFQVSPKVLMSCPQSTPRG